MTFYKIFKILKSTLIYLNLCVHLMCRVKALAMAPGNTFLFSASSDGTIRAWKMSDTLVNQIVSAWLYLLLHFYLCL